MGQKGHQMRRTHGASTEWDGRSSVSLAKPPSLPCIRLLLSAQTGGNESSALFCIPTVTEVTGSEQEWDEGEGADTCLGDYCQLEITLFPYV